MKLNTKDGYFDVTATKTDSAGNGYYRASNGNMYYGNAQNGYLTETEQTMRLKAEKNAQNNTSYNSFCRSSSLGSNSTEDSILDALAFKAGTKLGELLIKILEPILVTVLPFLFKVFIAFGVLPALTQEYMREFIAYNGHIGCKLLSILVLVALIAQIVYEVYRKIKGQKSLSKPLFFADVLCLTGIYYLNTMDESSALLYSLMMAVITSYAIKVFSDCMEKIVYQVRKKICAKK